MARGPEHCRWESTIIAQGGADERMFVRDLEGAAVVDLGGDRWERWPEVLPAVGCA